MRSVCNAVKSNKDSFQVWRVGEAGMQSAHLLHGQGPAAMWSERVGNPLAAPSSRNGCSAALPASNGQPQAGSHIGACMQSWGAGSVSSKTSLGARGSWSAAAGQGACWGWHAAPARTCPTRCLHSAGACARWLSVSASVLCSRAQLHGCTQGAAGGAAALDALPH